MTKSTATYVSMQSKYGEEYLVRAKEWDFEYIVLPMRRAGMTYQKPCTRLFVVALQDIPITIRSELPNGRTLIDVGGAIDRPLLLVVNRDNPDDVRKWSWFEITPVFSADKSLSIVADPVEINAPNEFFDDNLQAYLSVVVNSVSGITPANNQSAYQPLSASELSEHPDYGCF